MRQLAKNLYYLRKSAGIKQAEIPSFIDVGRSTWSNYENDQTEPDISTLVRISHFFKVDLHTLIQEDLEANGKGMEIDHINPKGKEFSKPIGKVMNEKSNYYVGSKTSAPVIDYEKEIALKDQLIAAQAETIDSLKQANKAYSKLVEQQNQTIIRLDTELTNMQIKTPGLRG